GTALGILLARNGRLTWLWGNEEWHIDALLRDRQNSEFLPGVSFPSELTPNFNLEEVLATSRDLLVVVPSHAFREVLGRIRPGLRADARVAWATKGLEPETGRPLSEVATEMLGSTMTTAVVSGPTFASEVARGLPTAITVACSDPGFSRDLAQSLQNDCFRVYLSDDIVGVGIGGAVKNILAIAAGIADGLGFGANTRAALITRGLAEMTRLGIAAGGSRDTFMGLAGLGDLVLTCTDNQSRNRRMGLALAKGKSQEDARDEIGQVVEGVTATREVACLAERLGVDMPISRQVFNVLYEGLAPRDAVQALLSREGARGE
ncbi:MAG: NAD(P)-dependent glycerol-3-phosphate dehydrogenase, partial [Gammaproteobacteria bacterium]|nr:NAD(P)-dependent glycerol-3-phosphate dehydrogenase [Gammaproteobacteria bacterium]